MIPDFAPDEDFLIPGIHEVTWQEFVDKFGYTEQRVDLIKGLMKAVTDLRSCGCIVIYVDGSFVTKKLSPNDIDVCWDRAGVDIYRLEVVHPVFVDDYTPGRQRQKAKYKCEFFQAQWKDTGSGKYFLDLFQQSKEDKPKGILQINIEKI
jgi:hypothetical protein